MIVGIINQLKFGEFRKAIKSIDTEKIVDLIDGWGKKYFGELSKLYLEEVRIFLADIVIKIGRKIA
jgi:hypothetical protein